MEGEIKEVVENECGSAERESSNLALHCDPRRSTMYACGRGQLEAPTHMANMKSSYTVLVTSQVLYSKQVRKH